METPNRRANNRLPPEVNRVLFVRNLPFKITAEEMYDIFGKYGPIRQIRMLVGFISLICCYPLTVFLVF
jgi:pre-mRNA branch site protein p14